MQRTMSSFQWRHLARADVVIESGCFIFSLHGRLSCIVSLNILGPIAISCMGGCPDWIDSFHFGQHGRLF